MSLKKVVVLQESQTAIDFVLSVLNEIDGVTVVASSSDGEEGINLIKTYRPELLITGLILRGFDGFSVLEKLRRDGVFCKTVVLSSLTSDEAINKALSIGAVYYIAKPCRSDMLKARIKEVALGNFLDVSPNVFEKKRNTLDEKISKIFISVGIPPHIKGYGYLREGVKMAVENPEIINNITKKLYPKIGERFNTTPSKVERAIRHAIEVAWNRGRIETINNLLGIRAYVGGEKPTNGEFIALIADKMLLEGA